MIFKQVLSFKLKILTIFFLFTFSFFEIVLAKTLQDVKKRGFLKCGVSRGLVGFSVPNSKGIWEGIDIDLCRSYAAAIFGDSSKVKFVPLSGQQRFAVLQSGEIDILNRNTTLTLTRDTSLGLNFLPTYYYDGQGFMVWKKLGVKSVKGLAGATICLHQGTTTELNVADYFRSQKMKFKPLVFESNDEVLKAFFSGRCDVFSTDTSGLASERLKVKDPNSLLILPEIISKEPLSAAVRQGDEQWFNLTRWTLYALMAAEEMGIHSKNVDEFLKSTDPKIRRFLGVIPGNGKALGVDEKWAYHIIKKVGNYEEIFEKNVGSGSLLKLPRGFNKPWTKGGLLYAPPFK